MAAYYNEIDPFAAQWLRNLITAGHIAPGDVDERSIVDVRPAELVGYEQCHFFAGIGVWSYALRAIGWPDDRPIWTGSCPCQPFSGAGEGVGFADERHLWPSWFWLIQECRPPIIAGEQVAHSRADPWVDLVQDDLEGLDYAFGAVAFPAAGIGAPNIRERTYWMAYANGWDESAEWQQRSWEQRQQPKNSGSCFWMGDACGQGLAQRECEAMEREGRREEGRAVTKSGQAPTGFWNDVEWLECRDGKFRPTQPGIFPLVNGHPGRLGQLRAYGNAINAQAAIAFLEAAFAKI